MRWDDAIEAILQRLAADAALTGALGGAGRIVRADGSAAPPVPGITYQVTSSRRRENDELVYTRWDLRAPTLAGVVTLEERLGAHLDRRVPETLGGMEAWLEHLDAWDVPESPAGVIHRTALFRITVPRG